MEGRAPSPPATWDSFFSDFYLRAYADHERQGEAEAQALAAARLAGCPDGGDLLDVPCGFGRHSVPLARASYRVVGVDRSDSLLAEAQRRAGGERWPKLVRADYRELPFADESFDAAINLFTSLGYLGDEQDTRVLGEIGRVLRPGAHLVIETMHGQTGFALLLGPGLYGDGARDHAHRRRIRRGEMPRRPRRRTVRDRHAAGGSGQTVGRTMQRQRIQWS